MGRCTARTRGADFALMCTGWLKPVCAKALGGRPFGPQPSHTGKAAPLPVRAFPLERFRNNDTRATCTLWEAAARVGTAVGHSSDISSERTKQDCGSLLYY